MQVAGGALPDRQRGLRGLALACAPANARWDELINEL